MGFQNISCYCLSECDVSERYITTISKHLMLLFISDAITRPGTVLGFQNISCYCLSAIEIVKRGGREFQNISCYCLSMWRTDQRNRWTVISKHLMLLFITVLAFGLNATAYFKTSHVIVYRCGPSAVTNVTIAFQNISCYCLSRIVVVAVNLALTFQNISCYCLSPTTILLCV